MFRRESCCDHSLLIEKIATVLPKTGLVHLQTPNGHRLVVVVAAAVSGAWVEDIEEEEEEGCYRKMQQNMDQCCVCCRCCCHIIVVDGNGDVVAVVGVVDIVLGNLPTLGEAVSGAAAAAV